MMKQKLYQLLMVEHRERLEKCYQQVFFGDAELQTIKTFEDFLGDFYLYLLQGHPKYVTDDTEGYYLQQVKDEKALPEWLRKTFHRFLLDEIKIMKEMKEAVDEYKRIHSPQGDEALRLTLMHVAFSLAWFSQHEDVEDRYLFFRSAYKHFSGFYSWPDDDLNDIEVAKILGISHGTLRTRTTRLCAKVRRLVTELNDAMISTLNRNSLDIAHSIYAEPDPDIEAILEDLLGRAERELPQYELIVRMRSEKRHSSKCMENIFEDRCESMSVMCDFSYMEAPTDNACLCSIRSDETSTNWIVRKFMELIKM